MTLFSKEKSQQYWNAEVTQQQIEARIRAEVAGDSGVDEKAMAE